MRFASRRASSRTSSETRSSNRITSADCSARTAFSVNNSASPGPAPTIVTRPVVEFVPAATSSIKARARNFSSAAGGATNARSAKRSQKARRCSPFSSFVITASRTCRANAPQAASDGGSTVSMRRRIACARIGAAPSVEMPITMGERLTIEPNWNWQNAGLSMTLTGTPAALAAAKKQAASPTVSTSASATAALAKLAADQVSAWCTSEPRAAPRSRSCAISGSSSAAYTSTCAPAAASNSAFHAAAAVPPARIARRPSRLRNTGSLASAPSRFG